MVPDFVRLGFTTATPLPNQGFPARFLGVEQHAAGRLLVPSRSSRLLQVVLQGSGNVGVDHEAYVRFVDAHAEGIGGGDGTQVAADKAILDVFPGLRRPSGVEVVRRYAFLLQELGHPLRCAAAWRSR